ncbi:MAG TPA: hypothetical protein VF317_04530, partial [Dermatophilaceae bacterium]
MASPRGGSARPEMIVDGGYGVGGGPGGPGGTTVGGIVVGGTVVGGIVVGGTVVGGGVVVGGIVVGGGTALSPRPTRRGKSMTFCPCRAPFMNSVQ